MVFGQLFQPIFFILTLILTFGSSGLAPLIPSHHSVSDSEHYQTVSPVYKRQHPNQEQSSIPKQFPIEVTEFEELKDTEPRPESSAKRFTSFIEGQSTILRPVFIQTDQIRYSTTTLPLYMLFHSWRSFLI